MTSLIVFFIAGYVFYIVMQISQVGFPLEIVTGLMFLGGSVFVFLVIGLSKLTIGRVQESDREIVQANARARTEAESIAETMTRELSVATAALIESRDAALEASRTKSTFLANMSHELRTPLNAVIGYSEMLIEESAADVPLADFVPDLLRIKTAGRHLLALINDILDLSKIEAGKMDLYFEDFEVVDMIDDVVGTMRPLVEKNGNALVVECGAIGAMRADLTKVRQTLFNLLGNAAKFTQGGLVMLSARRDGDDIEFVVTDSGIGMTPEQVGRLFQAFSQAEAATTRKYGGTGLGLAISSHFCRMMGGAVSASSTHGAGSRFVVRLPARVAEPPPPELPGTPSSQAAGRRVATIPPRYAPLVLVIDDDPDVRDILARTLVNDGFRVVVAADGAEGLRLARAIKPAAITLDVMMPTTDGWAVLAALKADPVMAEIPVIMATMADDRHLGFALGASAFLVKPIDRERLVALLHQVLNGSPQGRVLVVDDDPVSRELSRRTIDRIGCEVVEAENGQIAVDLLAGQDFSVVVLDLMMPVMDGFMVLDWMRRSERHQRTAVLVVTAKDLSAEERVRLSGETSNILCKGNYSREDLLAQVRVLIAGSISRKDG